MQSCIILVKWAVTKGHEMKILVISINYYPEPARITDICEELVKYGHDVTVVTNVPNCPHGDFYDGYSDGRARDEVRNGVKIHRCFTIARKKGAVKRVLSYYSYVFSSINYVRNLKNDFDVVFVNQLSPVMLAYAGAEYKRLFHKKILFYSMDLWPMSLTIGGIKEGSLIYKYFHRVSEKLYKSADVLYGSSRSFPEYFEREFGITGMKYLPQYAEGLFSPEQCRKEPDEIFDLMFAGNIGNFQSVDTIIRAAALTKENKRIRWHILGDGSEMDNIKQLAANLNVDNVVFHGRKPLGDMPKYYSMADAMLVTMTKNPVISLTLPGKVQSYMAAGKPLLGAIDGETRLIIKEADCGLCGDAENAEQLAQNAEKMSAMSMEKFAKNSFAYNEKYFTKEKFMRTLISELERLSC